MSVIATGTKYHTLAGVGSSTDVDSGVHDGTTRGFAESVPVFGAWTSEQPITVISGTADGLKEHSFLDDYYYRIWIIPSIVNLGRIISESDTAIEIWNSFFEPRDFGPIAITGDDSGLTLSGDDSGTFNTLESQIRTLHCNPAGAARVDVTYDFAFQGDGDTASVLRVLGVRLVVFLLRHNWLNPVLEQLAFKTDVLTGISGVEQRCKLRQVPRRRVEMSYLTLTREERMYMENALYSQNIFFAVPLWQDVGMLRSKAGGQDFDVDTRGRDYEVGGMVFLLSTDGETSEALEIESFTDDSITTVQPSINNYEAGSKVCPARFGILEGKLSIGRHTNQVDEAKLAWLIDTDADRPNQLEDYEFDTYQDMEIFDQQNDYGQNLDQDQEARRDMMDNDIGLIAVETIEPFPRRTYPFSKLMTRDEFPAFLQWFYNRSGRLTPFWWIDRVRSFVLTDETAFDSITMTVKTLGYAEFMFLNPSRRTIAIKNGDEWICRTVTNAAIQDDGNTILTLDEAPGVDLHVADDPFISLLRKVRLESDQLEISYETSNAFRAVTKFIDVF